jgi:serine/threonine-protein kinase
MPTGIEATPLPDTPPAAGNGPLRGFADDVSARGVGLRARLFLGSAALLVFTIGLAVAFLTREAQRVAEAKIKDDLKTVPAIYEGYKSSQASARERQLRSLAREAGTKALLAEVREHPETFHDSAKEFARALGARTVFFFDADGILLARSDRAPGEEAGRDFSGIAWVDTPRERMIESSAFILEVTRERALSLVASSPVTQGAGLEQRLNGVIAASFEMSGERARELALLTRGETAFVANVAPRGATRQLEVLAATPRLPPLDLQAGLRRAPAALERAFEGRSQPEPIELDLAGDSYIATAVPIRSGQGEVIAALVVARSKDAEMAPFRQIRQSLLAVGGVALLLSVPLSFALAQGLAGPIRKLADGARQIARGDLDVSLPATGAGEVGALARAFSGMVSELREKAQLEALVADMQRRPGDITLRGALPGGAPGESGLGVGRVFAGRYEILSELGRGGMGTVFRARDRELDDEVALKVLKTERDDQGAQVERLRQEIKIARAITHVNVVRAFDFGEAERTRYLTMEYVAGTTLRELIDARRGLELTPALQIAKQVCRGLAAVHKAGIVHGDLKPQNVMVMGNGIATLMDFGVARPRARQEQGGLVVAGTPLYMSPEQVKGGDLDDRSDIYSAGVVMFEMFTGQCPFLGKDIAEILQMHLNDPPPDPRTLRPGLPQPLAQLILACLSKHRLQRPGSAADLDRLLMRVRV